ncbi:12764_t:CDS:1 [Ambispora gerdemannii]|uniref:12764_t:CDS:1 n=1 Tax=Ambispora gerdemannii TaxID=144530 RepID=A0A9N9CIQ6_9GLOM|nr:12764_t:CDS:1 [Ambispora gerdemannii]
MEELIAKFNSSNGPIPNSPPPSDPNSPSNEDQEGEQAEQPTPPQPTSNAPKSKNPIADNNNNSEKNIKKILNFPLDEARKKAEEEIRKLFDRYGVKDQELIGNNL